MNINDIKSFDRKLINEKFKSEEERTKAAMRLIAGEPLAYIIGEWYFWKETYKVTSDCLIPRPETEFLVEYAIKNIPENGIFIDLCTGSGCVAISILASRKDVTGYACDISPKALEIARYNAEANAVDNSLTLIECDINDLDFVNLLPKFDVITANPPYIRTKLIESLDIQVRKEPYIALDGGEDGFSFYRSIEKFYKNLLCENGKLIIEIGYDQANDIIGIFGDGIVIKDYSDNDRVFIK